MGKNVKVLAGDNLLDSTGEQEAKAIEQAKKDAELAARVAAEVVARQRLDVVITEIKNLNAQAENNILGILRLVDEVAKENLWALWKSEAGETAKSLHDFLVKATGLNDKYAYDYLRVIKSPEIFAKFANGELSFGSTVELAREFTRPERKDASNPTIPSGDFQKIVTQAVETGMSAPKVRAAISAAREELKPKPKKLSRRAQLEKERESCVKSIEFCEQEIIDAKARILVIDQELKTLAKTGKASKSNGKATGKVSKGNGKGKVIPAPVRPTPLGMTA